MRPTVILLGAVMLCLFLGTQAARTEEPVPPDRIPKKVLDALLARFPKAKIDKCTKAKEGGAVVYDIEFKQQNGKKGEADIKEDGTYINFEKEIDARDLTKAVRDAIDRRYPKSTLKEIMEETEVKGKDEKLSAYEVVLLTTDNRTVEVRVSPEGKLLEDTGAKKPANKK